jgi:acetyltransferase-like isoleucine patch superfamily enzyme
VGGGSAIYDTDFHSLDPEERSRPGNRGALSAPVSIGRRAFVGGHSILLKGTTIGEAAVVGAGSVVRAAVPPGQVWAGNPARLVRDLRVVAAREPVRAAPGAEVVR